MAASGSPTFRAWTHAQPPFGSTLSLGPQCPPLPAALAPTELLVEVHAAALNPLDLQLRSLALFRLPALARPYGLGCDFAGVVLARGRDTHTRFALGAHVMGVTVHPLADANGGTLAQIAVIDLARSAVVVKPAHLDWLTAAALPLAFLTAKTLLSAPYLLLPDPVPSPPHTPPNETETVSLHHPTIVVLGGSTAVGQHVLQLASRQLHLRVIATCSVADDADFVRGLGAVEVIHPNDDNDLVARVHALRPPEGYLSILDCVGGTVLLPHLAALLTPRRTHGLLAGGSYTTIVGDHSPSPPQHRTAPRLAGAIRYWWCWAMLARMLLGWIGLAPRYACIDFARNPHWLAEVGPLTRREEASDDANDPDPDQVEPRRRRRRRAYQVPIDSVHEFEHVDAAFERLMSGRVRGKVVVRIKD